MGKEKKEEKAGRKKRKQARQYPAGNITFLEEEQKEKEAKERGIFCVGI